MKDTTPRQLFKQIDGGYAAITFEGGSVTTATAHGEGWESIPQIDQPGQACIVNRQYIDLAGYTQKDLTLFISGVDIQRDKDPLNATPGTIDVIWEYDLITTRRIKTTELSSMMDNPVGFLPQTLDLQEVIYGEIKTHGNNLQIPISFITTKQSTFGSGNAVASDRLHWTKIYLIEPNASSLLNYYPNNLAIQAITGREKDLVYIERLRRAYTQERS